MRELPLLSHRQFRTRARRRSLSRSAHTTVRKGVKWAVLIAAPFFGAGVTLFPAQLEPVLIASLPANSAPTQRLPRVITMMAVDGAIASLVQGSLKAANGAAAIPQFAGTLGDTWLNAFYGDKHRLKAFIEHTADASGLPVDFFLRLLQQESGLDHRAVSRAGAQGVAQFMPATAAERGLVDPFDPFEAIPKAAEFLCAQRVAFGSLGLAAAAYNAGPQRVRNWLAGRSSLPQETRSYVMKITGRSAEDWRQGGEIFAIAAPTLRDGW